MPYKKYPLLNKKSLKTIPIKEKKSLVDVKDFGMPLPENAGFSDFIESLPNFLAARDLREFIGHMKNARQEGKPIILGMGAHVVKVGLSPVIIDLMERGWVSALAVNGAFMIHDFEIAFCGGTSEDVAENLHKGNFGNAEETGIFLNIAMKEGNTAGLGAGEAVGGLGGQAVGQHLQQPRG